MLATIFSCEKERSDSDLESDGTSSDNAASTDPIETSRTESDSTTVPIDTDDAWMTINDRIVADDFTLEGDFTISDEWIKKYGDLLFLGKEVSDIKYLSGFVSYSVSFGEKEQSLMNVSFERYSATVGGKTQYIYITEAVESSRAGQTRKLCDISVSTEEPDAFDNYTRCYEAVRIVNSDPRFTGIFDTSEPRSQGNVSFFNLTELSMDILKKNIRNGLIPTLDNCLTDGKSLFCRYYVMNTEDNTMHPDLLIRIDTKTRKVEQIDEKDFLKLPYEIKEVSPDGKYSAEFDDKGSLYVKNKKTGEKTLVSEAFLIDKAVQNIRSPIVWGFTDDNKLIYYVIGYESFERTGVYDCVSGKNLFTDGMHSPTACIDGVLYTVATQYLDGEFRVYSIPLNAEKLVETPVRDPNGLVTTDYDGSYKIYKNPSSGKIELILLPRVYESETTFLRLGIGENGFELIQTERIDSRFNSPDQIQLLDDSVKISCQRHAGCGDCVVMVKLK